MTLVAEREAFIFRSQFHFPVSATQPLFVSLHSKEAVVISDEESSDADHN